VTDRQAERRNERRRLSAQLGLTAAVLFVLVMAAGADLPPPPGFVLVIAYGVLLGVVVWRALPLMLDLWDARGVGPVIGRAALAGFLAGLALWALTSVISTGEPSIDVDGTARLIGFTVVGVVGALGATALTATGRLLDRRRSRRP
jgi:hypothetical protein